MNNQNNINTLEGNDERVGSSRETSTNTNNDYHPFSSPIGTGIVSSVHNGEQPTASTSPTVKHVIGTGRDHLANERTYLAWIRTALALMGASIGLIKWGGESDLELEGYLLGLVGIVAVITSTRRYFYVMRQLNRDEVFVPNVIGISFVVAVASIAYIVAFSVYYVGQGNVFGFSMWLMLAIVTFAVGYAIHLARQHHHIRVE